MSFGFDLDLLRTFVAVVECDGFTRAAERVHLTQSTVSQQVKKLETNLGHTLLLRDKSTGGVQTTEEGEVLLSYARKILATAQEAIDAMSTPQAPKTVRLGVPEDFAGRRLIDLLSGFAAASPHIRLDTVSGWSTELRRLLDAGEIDLALIKREPGDGACLASWKEELVWVDSASRPVRDEIVPLAVFPVGCIYRERAIRAIERSGRRWRIAYTSQGLMGVQAAVASGLGISLLPSDALLPDHRKLGPAHGFEAQKASELALVKGKARLSNEAKSLGEFLAGNL
ncbi:MULTISPECIES: LysR substrate-binding domain-containing protein [unclassified Rhizobium]|uniref:LysR substrate-binding domain-containing protein n=1 Tax=unclassified Rhizobium TaxID=2613769 RepID=UPI000713A524|nr:MULTISPECIES: LysR family transcriptional regulator [unclassified Rhizobium]KQS95106.1 LysR family transcriptional regulator [Rhizobium sp. Leaf386]KQS95640.1 LysR family transcriptional regulator [Rhizobium sp. Leaf391]KQU01867.1 LysR family transcriptional regulator [Rhizobium sp. Leaf453]